MGALGFRATSPRNLGSKVRGPTTIHRVGPMTFTKTTWGVKRGPTTLQTSWPYDSCNKIGF